MFDELNKKYWYAKKMYGYKRKSKAISSLVQAKKPTTQITHLVFANTQTNPEKPKEQFLANAPLNKIFT